MLIVNFAVVTVFFVVAMLCSAYTGFTAWHLLLQNGEKTAGETMLFVTIIVLIILLILWIRIVLRSHKRTHSIEKVIDLARINGLVDKDSFNDFGKLGIGLKTLYSEVENISEKRAQRLYFMDELVSSLFNIINEKIIVLDMQGTVLYAGHKTFQKNKNAINLEKQNDITEIYPDFDFKNAASKCFHEHSAVAVSISLEVPAVCIPIYGRENTANGFLLLLDNLELTNVSLERIIEHFRTEKRKTTEPKIRKHFFRR